MDANKILKRYADGKINFKQVDLKGISLIKVNASEIDLNDNLNWASLKRANISKSNLKSVQMTDIRTDIRVEKSDSFVIK
jgi:uncharacterized protein YjbI with pentapeptide repeats